MDICYVTMATIRKICEISKIRYLWNGKRYFNNVDVKIYVFGGELSNGNAIIIIRGHYHKENSRFIFKSAKNVSAVNSKTSTRLGELGNCYLLMLIDVF